MKKKLPQIQIVEKETLLVSNEITKTFNKHFAKTVQKLNTFEWRSNNQGLTDETLTKIIKKIQEPSKYRQN